MLVLFFFLSLYRQYTTIYTRFVYLISKAWKISTILLNLSALLLRVKEKKKEKKDNDKTNKQVQMFPVLSQNSSNSLNLCAKFVIQYWEEQLWGRHTTLCLNMKYKSPKDNNSTRAVLNFPTKKASANAI